MFNPERLCLARRRRGLTKRALAQLLDVMPLTILRYEHGEVTPPDRMVERLAEALSFPASFFFGPEFDEPRLVGASFRSMSAMSARERDAALAAGTLAFMLSDWVQGKARFVLPECALIDLKGETPEAAARSLRQKWDLGERPIKHVVRLLEAKGVRVFSLVENTRTVDAFSLWRKSTPYIFLNTVKSGEHSRFDAAHELGHLVLHKHGGPKGREAEDEAHQFAASFLMPLADVLAVLPCVGCLGQIVQAKKRWGVSVAALNYRLHQLKITSDWQYRMFCIQLTSHGYRETEPYAMRRETSEIWQKVLDALRAEGKTKHHIAEALSLPVAEVENLVFGLANMLTVEGGGSGHGRGRADLRLVSG